MPIILNENTIILIIPSISFPARHSDVSLAEPSPRCEVIVTAGKHKGTRGVIKVGLTQRHCCNYYITFISYFLHFFLLYFSLFFTFFSSLLITQTIIKNDVILEPVQGGSGELFNISSVAWIFRD